MAVYPSGVRGFSATWYESSLVHSSVAFPTAVVAVSGSREPGAAAAQPGGEAARSPGGPGDHPGGASVTQGHWCSQVSGVHSHCVVVVLVAMALCMATTPREVTLM